MVSFLILRHKRRVSMANSKEKDTLDLNIYTKEGKLRKRKPKTKRDYFTQDTEDAIVKYIKSKSVEEREKIYNTSIRSSMEKLVECVVNSFSFDYVKKEAINLIDVQKEVLSFLINILSGDKNLTEKGGYRPSRGKAYSYFTRTALNRLIWMNKMAYKDLQQKTGLEGLEDDSRLKRQKLEEDTDKSFINFVHSFKLFLKQNMYDLFPGEGDRKIAEAFATLLHNASSLDIFNRKVLYFQIREETGAVTQDITRVLRQIKEDMANQLTIYNSNSGELDVIYSSELDDNDEYQPIVSKVTNGAKLPKPRWDSLAEWPGMFLDFDDKSYDVYSFTSPKGGSIPWFMIVDEGAGFNQGLVWEGERLDMSNFAKTRQKTDKLKYTLIDGRK